MLEDRDIQQILRGIGVRALAPDPGKRQPKHIQSLDVVADVNQDRGCQYPCPDLLFLASDGNLPESKIDQARGIGITGAGERADRRQGLIAWDGFMLACGPRNIG